MSMLTSLRLCYKLQSHITFDISQSSQLRRVSHYGDFSIAAGTEPLRHLKSPSRLAFRDRYKADDVVRTYRNFLRVAPFLEELHLEFERGLKLQSSLLDSERLVHPGLRRLELFPYQGAEVFIDNVTIPSLETLDFACEAQDGGQKLLRLFERSLPPLTYLSIHEGCAHEDNLIPCLELLPTLVRLKIISPPVSTRFFRELIVTGGEPGDVLCPSLVAVALFDIKSLEDSAACAEALKILATFANVLVSPIARGQNRPSI